MSSRYISLALHILCHGDYRDLGLPTSVDQAKKHQVSFFLVFLLFSRYVCVCVCVYLAWAFTAASGKDEVNPWRIFRWKLSKLSCLASLTPQSRKQCQLKLLSLPYRAFGLFIYYFWPSFFKRERCWYTRRSERTQWDALQPDVASVVLVAVFSDFLQSLRLSFTTF